MAAESPPGIKKLISPVLETRSGTGTPKILGAKLEFSCELSKGE